jgi:hypothetical protein
MPFNPILGGSVYGLAVAGNHLFAGGSFNEVDGNPRSRLAAFERTLHTLAAWNPGANGDVLTLLPCGSRLVAGGKFTLADEQLRRGIAVLEQPVTLGTEDVPAIRDAGKLRISAVAPHPAGAAPEVVIQVEEAATIRIDLVDAAGRLVKRGLFEEPLPAGLHARRGAGRWTRAGLCSWEGRCGRNGVSMLQH